MTVKSIFLKLFLFIWVWMGENKNAVPENRNVSGNDNGECNTLWSISFLKVYWSI